MYLFSDRHNFLQPVNFLLGKIRLSLVFYVLSCQAIKHCQIWEKVFKVYALYTLVLLKVVFKHYDGIKTFMAT